MQGKDSVVGRLWWVMGWQEDQSLPSLWRPRNSPVTILLYKNRNPPFPSHAIMPTLLMGGTHKVKSLPSPGRGRQQLSNYVSPYYREEKRRDAAGVQIKRFMFPWSAESERKKSCSDWPSKQAQGAMGRLDNGTVQWKRAKGLSSQVTKAVGRGSIVPSPSHATGPGPAFLCTLNCVFTSIVANVSGPQEVGEPGFWHGWRTDCRGTKGTFPEEWALFLNTPIVSPPLEAKNAEPGHAAVIDCD